MPDRNSTKERLHAQTPEPAPIVDFISPLLVEEQVIPTLPSAIEIAGLTFNLSTTANLLRLLTAAHQLTRPEVPPTLPEQITERGNALLTDNTHKTSGHLVARQGRRLGMSHRFAPFKHSDTSPQNNDSRNSNHIAKNLRPS